MPPRKQDQHAVPIYTKIPFETREKLEIRRKREKRSVANMTAVCIEWYLQNVY